MAYSTSHITAQDKLREIERELGQRRRVYARMVEQGRMSPALAEKQIAIMVAIRDDYVALAAKERLL